MNKVKSKIAVLSVLAFSGCAVHQDRTGYSEAWYYERLSPYYKNTLSFRPRVSLRAVRELVGTEVIHPNGVVGHADYFRSDIEIFFAAAIADQGERLNLARSAIRITCPETDIGEIEDNMVYSDETYVVFEGVRCIGYATS